MTGKLDHAVFIEPSSFHFLKDRLFDVDNAYLNRDGTLVPFWRLREELRSTGVPVHTADLLRDGKVVASVNHYWSLGMLEGYPSLIGRSDVRLRGFFLMEPSLVAPRMYRALPEVSKHFESVYVHNSVGHCYSLTGVDQSKLRKLYWPQPYPAEQEPYWSRRDRLNKLVVIAGNHNPRFRRPELYSARIKAVAELVDQNAIDLYGMGWDRWWSRHSAWLPYWRHRSALMRAYRGRCESKLETLSGYRFCLCLENMPMAGYLTEKLFDCLYAGTVPLYLGAPDIENLVPPEVFVDIRSFSDFTSLYEAVRDMSDSEWQQKREAGREFLRGQGGRRHFDFLADVCGQL